MGVGRMKIHQKELDKAYSKIFSNLEYIIRAVVQDELMEISKEQVKQSKGYNKVKSGLEKLKKLNRWGMGYATRA
jgi:hypothetical protein